MRTPQVRSGTTQSNGAPSAANLQLATQLMNKLEAQAGGNGGKLRDVSRHQVNLPASEIDQSVLQQRVKARFGGDVTVDPKGDGAEITVYGLGAIHAYGPNARKI